jgi:hypothetical protein
VAWYALPSGCRRRIGSDLPRFHSQYTLTVGLHRISAFVFCCILFALPSACFLRNESCHEEKFDQIEDTPFFHSQGLLVQYQYWLLDQLNNNHPLLVFDSLMLFNIVAGFISAGGEE